MNTLSKTLVFALFMSLFTGFALPALAYNPTLNVYGTSANISGGQPYASVVITYTPSGSSLQTTITGTTDYNGNFTVDLGSINSSVNQITATVGGQYVTGNYNGGSNGCTYNCGSPYGLSLSQNSLSLTSGQSQSVTVYNSGSYSYGNFYISSNSSPYVASATISGNQVNVYGSQSGSTTLSICQNSGNGGCASLYVTVNGNNGCTYNCGNGNLSLSQSSVSLNSGQSATVNVYSNNYGGNIYISSNSNPSAATATVNGSSIYVTGQNTGASNIQICQSGNFNCATLYVNVNANNGCGYNCGSGSLSLSQTSLNLSAGQSASVTAYSYNGGSLYISSNSSPSVVSVSLSGSVVNFYAIANGSSTVNICTNTNNQCASVYVSVGGGSYGNNTVNITDNVFTPKVITIPLGTTLVWTNNGSMTHTVTADDNSFTSGNLAPGQTFSHAFYTAGTFAYHCIFHGGIGGVGMSGVVIVGSGSGNSLSLSQSNVNLSNNQNTTIGITGSGGYYVSANTNPGVVTATIAGSSLYLNSLSSGNSTVTVCQALGSTQCDSVYVTVNGSSGTSAVWFSQNTVSLNIGQSQSVTIYSNNYGGNYYISSNPNSGMVSANVIGNTLNLNGLTQGTSTITVCQSSGSSNCGSVYVTVGGGGCTYNCGGNGNLSLSQMNINLNVGQSGTVNIYGNGGYSISSNSNSAVASATLSGSVVNLYGGQSGTTTIVICQNSGGCLSLNVTVGSGGGVLGVSTYQNGTLINENGTISIVYKNLKTAFANAAAFLGLGFNFGNVINVGNSGLSSSGYTVTTASAQHPWGSWIKSGSTVYFVHQSGLIPVPDWNTFLNNGGQASLIIPANTWDFRLFILSPMVSSDPRLR